MPLDWLKTTAGGLVEKVGTFAPESYFYDLASEAESWPFAGGISGGSVSFGSGTTGHLALWNGAILTTSIIQDSGTVVTINSQFVAGGPGLLLNNEMVGIGCGINLISGDYNCFFGDGSGQNCSSGNNNIFVGYGAGISVSTGSNNVAIGCNAFYEGNTSNLTAVGYKAAYNATASCEAFGYQALNALTSGTGNVAVGYQAGISVTTGSNNCVLGTAALSTAASYRCVIGVGATDNGDNSVTLGRSADTVYIPGFLCVPGTLGTGNYNECLGIGNGTYLYLGGQYNTLLGDGAGTYCETGNYNTAVGINALYGVGAGSENVAVGAGSLANVTANGCTAIGFYAGNANVSGTGLTAVGYQTAYHATVSCEAFGYQALNALTSGTGNCAFGYQSLTAETTGNQNTGVGNQALTSQVGGVANTAIGYFAGFGTAFNGSGNVFIGALAGVSVTSASYNSLIGYGAGYALTSGSGHTSLGYNTLATMTTGGNCTAIGFECMGNCTGSDNTALGYQSGNSLGSGTNNVFVGYAAGQSVTTGSHNCVVGDAALSTAASYRTVIGVGATDNGNNSVTLGRTSDTVYCPGSANICSSSGDLGFYGATPIAQATLATGAGHTVDDVILALQNLGLVKN